MEDQNIVLNETKEKFNLGQFVKKHLSLILIIALSLFVMIIAAVQFIQFRYYDAVFVVRDSVKTERLSKYLPKIEGTIGDSEIYIIGTEKADEPSILVLGGVHPNEPAGQMCATLLMEQIDVTRGTVYIITEANRSAYTHSHPQEATPMYYEIDSLVWGGNRVFKYGSRATNAVDQWPISDVYVHGATGQKLSGTDTRNLNRSFPGNENGNYTEQIAAAIVNLIKQRNITITLDFHEASPEYATNNAIVTHEKTKETGIDGELNILFSSYSKTESRFAPIKLEYSPVNLRGLTHRELGDATDTLPFLAEASNITQGRIRGAITAEDIVTGEDKFYQRASALGILEVDHSESVSLNERTGRHVETFRTLISAYNDCQGWFTGEIADKYKKGEFEIDYHGLSFTNIFDNGIGYYLRDPNDPNDNFWPSDND